MNAPEPDLETRRVHERITQLRADFKRRELFAGYARLYAALAVASAPMTFTPILEDQVIETSSGSEVTRLWGSLWDMAGRAAGEPAALGLLLAAALTALLIAATFRPQSGGFPVSIAGVSALIILMLVTRPGTGDPTPPLSPFGLAAMVLAVFALVLGVIHAVHHAKAGGAELAESNTHEQHR
jgi:hypothetical protein